MRQCASDRVYRHTGTLAHRHTDIRADLNGPGFPTTLLRGATVTPYAVEIRNVTKTFPLVTANDDVSLLVKKGEIHALVGENGAG